MGRKQGRLVGRGRGEGEVEKITWDRREKSVEVEREGGAFKNLIRLEL